MKAIVLSSFLFTTLIISCKDNKTDKDPMAFETALNSDIDTYIDDLMKIHKVPGMALAVVDKEGIIHKGYYGKMSIDTDKAITNKTIFKIFSLTKTMVATGIFRLIEEGSLSLDEPISKHNDSLPKKWKPVTIANLLSHSSGLPDVRKFEVEFRDDNISNDQFLKLLFNEEMDFVTGSQWSYNQTNYILLRMIMEKVTKIPFEDYILKHQFATEDPEAVYFSSHPGKGPKNEANYYNYDRTKDKFIPKPEFSGNKNLPLAGLNLTLDAYVEWTRRFDDGLLLSEATKKLMWTPFVFTNSEREFLNGWDVYKVNGSDSFGFSGGGVSGYRKFLKQGFSIIVLTTGYKNYAVQDLIIDQIAGMLDAGLQDKVTMLNEEITNEYLLSSDSVDVKKMVAEVKLKNPTANLEVIFNALGYRLFFDLDRKQEAIALFESNVLKYPESYDAYGSLGYLQLLTEQYEISRKNYVMAKELNPNNSYSDRRIKEIDAILIERR